jgi:predicted metalloprotease with PDZ domain
MRKGFGALERNRHYRCFTWSDAEEELSKSMKDVVSHEFFHIVTPLSIHSKEIQYFDYNMQNVRTFMDVWRSYRVFC